MNAIIQAYIENYDLETLREMLREKIAILEGRKEITGASNGGGTSYTATQVIPLDEHIELLQNAIAMKKAEEGDYSSLDAMDDAVRPVRFDSMISSY